MDFNFVTFQTDSSKYLFDGVSCNIFDVNESLFVNSKEIFENMRSNNMVKDAELTDYSEISKRIEEGFLIPVSNGPFEFWFDIDQYLSELKRGIQHLFIGFTEQCNMRCTYCVYGGHYKNERTHTARFMNFETIKKAIQYFQSIAKDSHRIYNFYGGEPLFDFEALKKAIGSILRQTQP